jgi:hypothetical protein
VGELEHEIIGKPIKIALDGLDQDAGLDPIEGCQVCAQHDPLTTQEDGSLLYRPDASNVLVPGHYLTSSDS